jgi:hypothetical protein
MLRNNSAEYHDKVPPIIEMFPIEVLKQVSESDGIFMSHLVPRHMPKDFMARKCKIINIYRNPKDIYVSIFNFIKKTKDGELMKDMEFDVFLDMCTTGSRKMMNFLPFTTSCFHFLYQNGNLDCNCFIRQYN